LSFIFYNSLLTKLDCLWWWDFRTNVATSSTKHLDFGFLIVILDNDIQVRSIRECYLEEVIQMISKKEVKEIKDGRELGNLRYRMESVGLRNPNIILD